MSALQPSGSIVPQWVRYIGAAVWISGPDRRIAWLNAHAERLLGRVADECVGHCCYGIVGARDTDGRPFCEPDCEILRRAQRGLPLPARKLCVDGDDDRQVYLLTIPVRATAGGPLMIVHCAVEEQQGHEQYALEPRRSSVTNLLTSREREVLDQLVSGAELRRIGEDLGISYSTVRNHVQHILTKLDVHSIREAIVRVLGPPRTP